MSWHFVHAQVGPGTYGSLPPKVVLLRADLDERFRERMRSFPRAERTWVPEMSAWAVGIRRAEQALADALRTFGTPCARCEKGECGAFDGGYAKRELNITLSPVAYVVPRPPPDPAAEPAPKRKRAPKKQGPAGAPDPEPRAAPRSHPKPPTDEAAWLAMFLEYGFGGGDLGALAQRLAQAQDALAAAKQRAEQERLERERRARQERAYWEQWNAEYERQRAERARTNWEQHFRGKGQQQPPRPTPPTVCSLPQAAQTLGVSLAARWPEVDAAFKRAALQWHPDRAPPGATEEAIRERNERMRDAIAARELFRRELGIS